LKDVMAMALLDGKVAIVTGGGRGIGRAHAMALAAAGAKVVVNDLGGPVQGGDGDEDPAASVVAEIAAAGGKAIANRGSVARWADAEALIAAAVDAFGRLDIVVNNAGINRPSTVITMTEADFDLEIAVHLKGTAAVSHFAAVHWAGAGAAAGRAIVNTTSPVGMHPMPGGGPYGAAKAGIAALTQCHAQELAALGVRVNAVAPAARTRMVAASPTVLATMPKPAKDGPDGGFDRHLPDHVATLGVYLASPLNRFTGRVFGVEGPDVALFRPWSGDELFTQDGGWTPETLAAALAEVRPQADTFAFFPGGRVAAASPPHRTMKALAAFVLDRADD
jgi:NAD(P)-dependent dehydrogenase (short-subunit alcohol dehydrogenase family)